jgi:uncharacterized protein YgbK (DUF1537 family)
MALLGAIADDFTGATDLASMLVAHGMRSVQLIGTPPAAFPPPEADALVIALKTRTAPLKEAVAESLRALAYLKAQGVRQVFFKYCSTFDSTDRGNIGPVADALLAALGASFALACPAFPANRRTLYLGHLFVGEALLNESGMENHPLTPMRDPNLVRVLSRQTTGRVGLVPYGVVREGAASIRAAFARLAAEGYRYAIVDAIEEAHLMAIGEAAADHPLITGGSGVAMGLPANFRRQGLLPPRLDAEALPAIEGANAVIAGSCSRATLGQIAEAEREGLPVLRLDPLHFPSAEAMAEAALAWARPLLGVTPVVIAASAPPDQVRAVQARLGTEAASALIEEALARTAEGLVAQGARRLVVAGGETSGAVVARLGVQALRIGPAIDPGVPWTAASGKGPELLLALKSGNFGAPDFFRKAFALLDAPTRS